MAKLTKLHVENFKRIQAVEIEPEGNITIVGGMNEQGKSSLLDKNNLKLIGKMAENAGIHCFVEVVGDDSEKATLIIENGMVKNSVVEAEIEEEKFADI